MHRQIAGKLTSPVTKWIVLVVVLVLTGFLGFLGGKLADVKNNEQSSWVPSSAESTKVADQLSGTVSPNDIPTLVAYHRSGGLTEADLAEIDAQAQEIAQIDGITEAGVLTPNGAAALQAQGVNSPDLISEDGEVAYTYFTFNMGKEGWNKVQEPIEEIHEITEMDGVDVYVGGFGGQAYDFVNSFDGSQVTLLLITFGVVIVILLITYRSPILWILPIFCAAIANTMAGGVVYLLAKYADLVVNDQSQYILSILVIGAGTDYALLLVARYREELRRHEDRHEAMAFALHRASPAIFASAATVVSRSDVPGLRRPQLHCEPRPGAGRRRGSHRPGHGDSAAGAAGDLRPLDLLAVRAGLRVAGAHPHRLLGSHREPHLRFGPG